MKKRGSRIKKTATRRTSSKSSRVAQPTVVLPFSFRRIILVTTCLVLFVFLAAMSHRGIITQSVAGMSIARGMFDQQTIDMPQIHPGDVVAYNIYYKETTEKTYTHAVRKLPTSLTKYTISYLKKNKEYQYVIAGLNGAGKEIWWSEIKTFFSYQAM